MQTECLHETPLKCAAFHSEIMIQGSLTGGILRWCLCVICARVINSVTGTPFFLSLQNDLGDDMPWEEVSWSLSVEVFGRVNYIV